MLKHENRGKIESHYWFYQGICEYLDPEFVQILDAGTIPDKYSTSRLIAEMEVNKNVGGICGEIVAYVPKRHPETGNSISIMNKFYGYAQYVEYKIAHYLDKASETIFGFVSVLPGAFSAFRWQAIKGKPLEVFFNEMKKLG